MSSFGRCTCVWGSWETYHSEYDGKVVSTSQTFSMGASIIVDADNENTPSNDGGGRFDIRTL